MITRIIYLCYCFDIDIPCGWGAEIDNSCHLMGENVLPRKFPFSSTIDFPDSMQFGNSDVLQMHPSHGMHQDGLSHSQRPGIGSFMNGTRSNVGGTAELLTCLPMAIQIPIGP